MSDQPERVGFEAYFDTKEFLVGVTRLIEALDKVGASITNLDKSVNIVSQQLSGTFGKIVTSSEKMADGVKSAMTDLEKSLKSAGFDVGQEIADGIHEIPLQKVGEEAGEALGKPLGEKAGQTSTDRLLIALTGAAISGDIKRVGGAIGSSLGAAIGLALGGVTGRDIGTILGGFLGGGAMLASLTGAGIGALIGSIVPGLGTAIGAGIGMALMGGMAMAIKSAAKSVLDAIEWVFGAVGGLVKGVLTPVIGIVENVFEGVRNVIRGISTDIAEDIAETFDAVKRLQAMDVSLGTLVRAGLVIEGQFENATDAIGSAIPITEKLRDALIDLSLGSPFTYEDIFRIFRVNTAFGISAEMSLKLTDAMSDLGAATGFAKDTLMLIARNLAQIVKQGQIYRRDLNQLANAGIDLALVLETQLGVSITEFNKGLKDGTYAMNDLLNAMNTFSDVYYGGAAEELSETLVGLENRFTTLKTVIMQDFLAPILSFVIPGIQTLADALGYVYKSGVFGLLGKFFADVGKAIVGDVDWTVESVAKSIMRFVEWLVDIATMMGEWGYKTMEAWGMGMLKGAFDALTVVVDFISRVMTSLFSTKSPPAILPYIDVWGAGTIEAWLWGMTQADFSIINRVISPIEQMLKNLGFEQPFIISALQDVVAGLSGALDVGELGGGLLGMMDQLLGPYANAMKDLLQFEFDLALAIKAVEEAQNALNESMEMYDKADENIRRLVREYNNLLRAGASDEVLDAKLAEIHAQQEQRSEAAKLIGQREEELEIAKESRKEAEALASAQRDLVGLLIRLTQTLEDKLGGAAGNIADEFNAAFGGLGDLDFGGAMSGLESELALMAAGIEIKLNNLRQNVIEPLIEQIKGFFSDEDGSFADFQTSLDGLAATFDEIGGLAAIATATIESWKELKLEAELVWQNIQLAWWWLMLFRALLSGELTYDEYLDLSENIRGLQGDIAGTKDELGELRGEVTTLGTDSEVTSGKWGTAWESISTSLQNKHPTIWGAIGGIIDLVTALGSETETTEGKFDTSLTNMGTKSTTDLPPIGELITGVATAINTLKTDTETAATSWGTSWDDILTKLNEHDGTILGKLGGISGAFDTIKTAIGDALIKLGDFLQALAEAVLPWWFTPGSPTPLETGIRGVADALRDLSTTGLPDFTSNLKLTGGADSIMNFQPTPTSSYTPSAINSSNISNTINMGGNTVRDDMDLALLRSDVKRTLRNATYGV